MEFTVDHFILAVNQLECMRTVAVHMTMSVRNATITEEEHNLMRRLRSEGNKVPKHVSILKRKDFINCGFYFTKYHLIFTCIKVKKYILYT